MVLPENPHEVTHFSPFFSGVIVLNDTHGGVAGHVLLGLSGFTTFQ
jgi:hypothetical protein